MQVVAATYKSPCTALHHAHSYYVPEADLDTMLQDAMARRPAGSATLSTRATLHSKPLSVYMLHLCGTC